MKPTQDRSRERLVFFGGRDRARTEDAVPERVGGKAAGLIRMSSTGLPVPAGFVSSFCASAGVPARRLLEAAERVGLPSPDPSSLAPQQAQRLASACEEVYEEHTGQPFPHEPWAQLLSAIGTVFDSWHSDRAEAYRRHNGLTGLSGTAVTVQEMFPSEVSGIAFTADPNRPDCDDVFFLRWEELDRFEGEREVLGDRIRDRTRLHRVWRRLGLPDVIDSDRLDDLATCPARRASNDAADGACLQGVAVAPGLAAGTAWVVHDPGEASGLESGYVLICPTTDPGWMPLFAGARALVMERGGVLSHGAIVARDCAIPAVVLPGAIDLLPTGTAVRVDGARGTVERMEGDARVD